MEGLETRAVDLEVEPSRDGRTLRGYAAVFKSKTRVPDRNGDFEEILMPGFADRSLREHGVPRMQWDHGRDARVGSVPIGRWDSWDKDGRGYAVVGHLFDNPVVEPVRQAIAEGAVDGLSFRFKVSKNGDKWERRRGGGGMDLRHVLDADLHEAGPVVFPAYKDAKVSIRSLMEMDVPILRSYGEYDVEDLDEDEVDESRMVLAYAVTWGSITEQRGDGGSPVRVRETRGAWDAWLYGWYERGKPPVPVLQSHKTPIGHLVDAWTDDRGVLTLAQFHDTADGRKALADIESGELRGYSCHLRVQATALADDGVTEVLGIEEVREIGPTDAPADRGANILMCGGRSVPPRAATFDGIDDLARWMEIRTGVSVEEASERARDEVRAKRRDAEETVATARVFAREVAAARRVAIEAYRDWTRSRRSDDLYAAQEADRAQWECLEEVRSLLTFTTRSQPLYGGEAPMVRQVLAEAGAPDYVSPFRGRDAAKAVLAAAGLGR